MFNRRFYVTGERISELKDRGIKIIQSEEQEKCRTKQLKKQQTIGDLQSNINHANVCVVQLLEGDKREKGTEQLFEKNGSWKFPEFDEKKLFFTSNNPPKIPSRTNTKRSTPQHIRVKLLKYKEQILKRKQEKDDSSHRGEHQYDQQLSSHLKQWRLEVEEHIQRAERKIKIVNQEPYIQVAVLQK